MSPQFSCTYGIFSKLTGSRVLDTGCVVTPPKMLAAWIGQKRREVSPLPCHLSLEPFDETETSTNGVFLF